MMVQQWIRRLGIMTEDRHKLALMVPVFLLCGIAEMLNYNGFMTLFNQRFGSVYLPYIYVAEALHRSGLSPMRQAGSVTAAEAARLAEAIRTVLGEAIAAGGSSLRDHRQTNGELGYFQHAFRVYDREGEPCPSPGCHGIIERSVQAGRSTFWCASCQI